MKCLMYVFMNTTSIARLPATVFEHLMLILSQCLLSSDAVGELLNNTAILEHNTVSKSTCATFRNMVSAAQGFEIGLPFSFPSIPPVVFTVHQEDQESRQEGNRVGDGGEICSALFDRDHHHRP